VEDKKKTRQCIRLRRMKKMARQCIELRRMKMEKREIKTEWHPTIVEINQK